MPEAPPVIRARFPVKSAFSIGLSSCFDCRACSTAFIGFSSWLLRMPAVLAIFDV